MPHQVLDVYSPCSQVSRCSSNTLDNCSENPEQARGYQRWPMCSRWLTQENLSRKVSGMTAFLFWIWWLLQQFPFFCCKLFWGIISLYIYVCAQMGMAGHILQCNKGFKKNIRCFWRYLWSCCGRVRGNVWETGWACGTQHCVLWILVKNLGLEFPSHCQSVLNVLKCLWQNNTTRSQRTGSKRFLGITVFFSLTEFFFSLLLDPVP